VRALLDVKPTKASDQALGLGEEGGADRDRGRRRDIAGGNVSVLRRDRLYREDGKLDSRLRAARRDSSARSPACWSSIQTALA
jgi:prolyl-tRNA synthetase